MSRPLAVILAAGRGVRLRPRTDALPKALLPVAGQTVLARGMAALRAGAGVREFVVVVGYRAEEFRGVRPPRGCRLRLVANRRWRVTNSSASLALAAGELTRGGYIVEGDCCFDEELFRDMPPETGQTLWFARRFTAAEDGCCLEAGRGGMVRALTIRKAGQPPPRNGWKSCGVLRLAPRVGALLPDWLGAAMREGRSREYYDLVLARHLAEGRFRIADIGSARWREVDDEADLARAEALFSRRG